MRNYLHIALLAFVVMIGTACTRVEPGYTGIEVNLHGSERGVSAENIVTGRVYFNPWTTNIYEFPTFVQQFTWTANRTEGSSNDDSITFNSREGVVVNADIFVAYAFEAHMVPSIFQEFRQEAEVITQTYVRGQVRDAFSRAASTMPIIQIYGEGKGPLLVEVIEDLRTNLGPKGFRFDNVSFVGALRVPENVKKSIDRVIQAQNEAAEAEARVAQRYFEAQQNVALAQGDYDAAILRAKANKELAASLSPTLIQYEQLQMLKEKWDGVMPKAMLGSGSQTLLSLSTD